MKPLSKLCDEELVGLYMNGENEAFDILLQRYKNKVYSYIFFIVRDKVLTEDIFQETFVKAIVTLKQGRYTENGKFPVWIIRIAHNLIIDHFRQEKNENTVSNDQQEVDLLNNINYYDQTVEDWMIKEQICSDVRKLVEVLPDNQKEVVVLRYYKNLSFKEIADLTGVSINTALGRMRYAIMNMRKMAEKNNLTLSFN
ncbi:MAG: sigma-70 family RNA polymerase sigma factor [Candidatus Azobacteroides sp.]|nr:sigma-70 family RNA polymerase sigma factor [Candidatus Azobacteroides sp.]